MNLGIPQIEEAVLETNVLACVGGGAYLEGQGVFALAENGDVLSVNLNVACGDLLIDGFLVALYDLAAEGDGALLIDIFQQIVVVNYDLEYAVLVADIEEHYAAVVADILDPARHANLLTDVFFSELTAAYCAVDIWFYHSKPSFQILIYPFYGIIPQNGQAIKSEFFI